MPARLTCIRRGRKGGCSELLKGSGGEGERGGGIFGSEEANENLIA